MCDRVIRDNQYYICRDCYKELLEDQKSWEPKTLTEVGEMIDAFMQTEPRSTYAVTGQDLEDEFRRLTGQLEDE